jgi:hypothetical protein
MAYRSVHDTGAVSQTPGRTTAPPDRGDHHPSTQTYTPVQAGTLSDPREKQDYFEQSWSGPKRFFGLLGGYKNLRTPSNTAQGHRSGIGGLLRGALGFVGGIPGKVASGFMTARDWATRTGQNIGEEVEEFGQYPTHDRWLNRYTDKYKDKPYRGHGQGYNFAQGGRIGYREGDPVIPEDENEDIYRFMQDQGIPFGERVEEVITDEQKAMVLDMLEKGMDMETIMSITGVGQEDIMSLMGGTSMAPEDQGLASLV